MIRNILLIVVGLFWAEFFFAQEKPNMIVFLVDDLGWADVGYRNPQFQTPNINKLKEDGMEFTRASVATPTCSPSRASLLTGREPVRFQMVRHILEGDIKQAKVEGEFNRWFSDPVDMPSRQYLPLEEVTYAERLQELGYYNAFVGKWHLGEKEYYPKRQGFDETMGVTPFGHPKSYYQPFFKSDNPFPESDDYLTDAVSKQATDFIRNYDGDKPFQLSLYHYGVHGPHIGKNGLIEQYKEKGWEGRYANYGSMVTAIDQSLGRLRQALEEKGIADNTVVLFTSDQGGYFTNFPLRGKKNGGFTLGEGGARVPFILYYPGVTKPNTTSDVPIQTLDVYPTLVEIASGNPNSDKQIQGKSLMPMVKGEDFEERNLYFFRSYEDQYAAIISGDWKLIKYHNKRSQLYNIKRDKGEVSNLIFVKPGIAKKLEKQLAQWEKEAVPNF